MRYVAEAGHESDGQSTGTDNVLRREGDYWSVDFDGRTARVRDLKGMRYLARSSPTPDMSSMCLTSLAAEGGNTQIKGGRTAGLPDSALGNAGELLDEQARNAYRRRLAEIDEDMDQAQAIGDTERAAHAATERDFLMRELSRAFGLGGRTRRAGSASERARAAVTRALRTAAARIDTHHPPLGEHLDRTVHTGTYCSYHPDPRMASLGVPRATDRKNPADVGHARPRPATPGHASRVRPRTFAKHAQSDTHAQQKHDVSRALHLEEDDVLEQLYGERADARGFGSEGLERLHAMVERAGGSDRLAVRNVQLGDDGFAFVESPMTPHHHW